MSTMAAKVVDGKALATEIREQIRVRTESFTNETGVIPQLVVVLVGSDPASQVYVRNKHRACERAGMISRIVDMEESSSTMDVLSQVMALNDDRTVHGILVQLPLPKQVDTQQVLDLIDPLKDVDAFHPVNVGLLSQGRPRFLPCTPNGIVQIMAAYDIKSSGKHVVVLGRSDIVGKPIASMLAQKSSEHGGDFANATVTMCHSRTENLAEITRQADILIAAIGKANFVTGDMIKPGAAVIDVGINRTDDGIVGDVDFESAGQVASVITPVPGGVGQLTVSMLLENALHAARSQFELSASQ